MSDIDKFLKHLVEAGGSDLHLKAGHAPVIRVHGELQELKGKKLTGDDLADIADDLVPPRLAAEFEVIGGADFAYAADGLGRFRVNVFHQRGHDRRRHAPRRPRAAGDRLAAPARSGRSVSRPSRAASCSSPVRPAPARRRRAPAMINHINTSRACTIVTLEDPIEILHTDKKALVNQREIGNDTESFRTGLKHAMRQDPDVIFVGEMRDPETVWAALAAAETGHFVISTLHTTDAVETVNRIIEFFPAERQTQIRHSLAGALKGIVCQRLLVASGRPRTDPRRRGARRERTCLRSHHRPRRDADDPRDHRRGRVLRDADLRPAPARAVRGGDDRRWTRRCTHRRTRTTSGSRCARPGVA